MSKERPRGFLNTIYSSTDVIIHERPRIKQAREVNLQLVGQKLKTLSPDASFDRFEQEKLEEKFFRLTPRVIGALVVYETLSGKTYEEIKKQEGLDLFHLFWFLGTFQDDFIDNPNLRKDGNKSKEEIKRNLFGKDFHRSVLNVIEERLRSSQEISSDTRLYLCKKIAGWYHGLYDEEAMVANTEFDDFTFKFCCDYREKQNQRAGETLVAILNGKNALDPNLQELEKRIPIFSYFAQIIDDIADLPEDLSYDRPSYAVGALVENPIELEKVKETVKKEGIKKMPQPRFERIAPKAKTIIRRQWKSYEKEVSSVSGKDGKILARIADVTYGVYPRIRNHLYRIHPHLAHF